MLPGGVRGTESAPDMTHAEVVPSGGPTGQTTTATPVYEYWWMWTIGHRGTKPGTATLCRKKLGLCHRVEDVAARMYLCFPIAGVIVTAGLRVVI